MEIDYLDIINYLGEPFKKIGSELVWQCPLCNALGQDTHKDNLHYNPHKKLLWCFADDSHSKQILSAILKFKKVEPITKPNLEYEFCLYVTLCNQWLLGGDLDGVIPELLRKNMFKASELEKIVESQKNDRSKSALRYFKKELGINTSTIEGTGLGFDVIDRKWVFPIFSLQKQLVGFEYRGADLKKKQIWREKGTPNTLAWIYGNGKNVYITEGYKDGYALVDYLEEKGNQDYMVCSCSHGVGSLKDCITDLHFAAYNKIVLILDNDFEGDKYTSYLLEKYPFLIDGRGFLRRGNYKDIDEWKLGQKKKLL